MKIIDQLFQTNLGNATDEQVGAIQVVSDDDLFRAANTLDLGAVIESNRRLRKAITEAKNSTDQYSARIVWLTWALVILTVALIVIEMFHGR